MLKRGPAQLRLFELREKIILTLPMTYLKAPKFRMHERGSVMLEFCLCLGLVAFLAFSAVSLGFAMKEHSTIVEAARVGARAASMVPPSYPSEEVTRAAVLSAIKYLESSGYQSADYRFVVNPESMDFEKTGTVRIIQLDVSRHGLAGYDFFTGLAVTAAASTQYPLADGNYAMHFDSDNHSDGIHGAHHVGDPEYEGDGE